ncbi:hypothetical protein SDC9_104381 [bioreactor metagenome]|uniref:Uncharacterized protein n=1 Tax=bioreactor metagenome TaxID=1076179 RepID=A0A645AWT0_9ZZZZ
MQQRITARSSSRKAFGHQGGNKTGHRQTIQFIRIKVGVGGKPAGLVTLRKLRIMHTDTRTTFETGPEIFHGPVYFGNFTVIFFELLQSDCSRHLVHTIFHAADRKCTGINVFFGFVTVKNTLIMTIAGCPAEYFGIIGQQHTAFPDGKRFGAHQRHGGHIAESTE